MHTIEDIEKALWVLYGETIKAVRDRLKSDDVKPADIANAIKLLNDNSMRMQSPRELHQDPQLVLDAVEALPFPGSDGIPDEDEI